MMKKTWFRLTSNVRWLHSSSKSERIVTIVNEHPYPRQSLLPTLRREIRKTEISTSLVEEVLGGFFGTHGNGLKAYEFFRYCLDHGDVYVPTSDAVEKTLHILSRMRYFDKAWELMDRIRRTHPSCLTLKSMSIVLSRIAKFRSYEETLEAFERMRRDVFTGKTFTTDEFNVLLRAFCTQRQMKEAKSVMSKMHSRFPPNAKTMNILLSGFKESGDIAAVELFHHEMVRRGFKPNVVTYHVRIDAYCKRHRFGSALRLAEEMESSGFPPSLQTITTLIHGAGLVRNAAKARELFDEIEARSLVADTKAYNALMSSLIRSRDVRSAAELMDQMEERNIQPDNMTYHVMFLGIMRSPDGGIDGVTELYEKMVGKSFVPKTRTAVMLMKFFCESDRVETGLDLWNYMMDRGHCVHIHALDLLVTGLCARGRVAESFACSKQALERGRLVSDRTFETLQRVLEADKLEEMAASMKKLKAVLPPSLVSLRL
ncbi:hypothetical protein M569_01712 [Genlisea aurea]|uniref:Pentacotripeptide-repeat region of PRORP domain-containing protein n=1 Tax=Genlisea aurea TaxID=192259 RepID=S8D6I9_9LAMI|nr:hypothetical protein M569_01712 [Genlisea aurea]